MNHYILKTFFLLALINVHTIFASSSSDYIVGVAKLKTHSLMTDQRINKELEREAFYQILNKRLMALRLNASFFWQKIDMELNDALEAYKTTLIEKENQGQDEYREPEKLQEKLDLYYRSLKARKLNVKKAIISYAKLNSTPSYKEPSVKYLKLKAKVDDDYLRSLYYQVIKQKDYVNIESLILDIKVNLVSITYLDLNIASRSEFDSFIINALVRWMTKENSNKMPFKNLVLKEKLISLLKDQPSTNEVTKEDGADNPGQGLSRFDISSEIDPSHKHLVKLQIELWIEKNKTPAEKEIVLDFKSESYLKRISDGKIIKAISKDNNSVTLVRNSTLGSSVATKTYTHVKELIHQYLSILTKIPAKKERFSLKFKDAPSFSFISQIMEKLENEGVGYLLEAEPQSYSTEMIAYDVYIDGESEDFEKLIQKSLSNYQSYEFSLEKNLNNFSLKVIRKEI